MKVRLAKSKGLFPQFVSLSSCKVDIGLASKCLQKSRLLLSLTNQQGIPLTRAQGSAPVTVCQAPPHQNSQSPQYRMQGKRHKLIVQNNMGSMVLPKQKSKTNLWKQGCAGQCMCIISRSIVVQLSVLSVNIEQKHNSVSIPCIWSILHCQNGKRAAWLMGEWIRSVVHGLTGTLVSI